MTSASAYFPLVELRRMATENGSTTPVGCAARGGAGKPACGGSIDPANLPRHIWEKVKTHPCYSEDAHHYFARMHVAVAPACNIQCNYCNRKYDCSNESRPGVTSERLTPEQAASKVLAVAGALPQLTVVGVAGPGDALANAESTFRTLDLVRRAVPDIKLCLSTNGLALPDHVERIIHYGVEHVTITINALDPEIGERIYPWIFFRHKRYTGLEAARILAERQFEGLEKLVDRGILVKINTVLIPGINDGHVADLNRALKARGAFLHNIMPLISDPEHGTHFGLTGQRGPSAKELRAAQEACQGGASLMRHCRQCRADAVGMLGNDQNAEFALARAGASEADHGVGARRSYQSRIEIERAARAGARDAASADLNEIQADIAVLVAVATKGGGRVNQHFGHASEFQIYEVGPTGVSFVGHRRVVQYCRGGYGEDEELEGIISALDDCHALLVAKIGNCPRAELTAAGIEPVDAYAHQFIEASATAWYREYLCRVHAGEVRHVQRGDAVLRQGAAAS